MLRIEPRQGQGKLDRGCQNALVRTAVIANIDWACRTESDEAVPVAEDKNPYRATCLH